MRKNISVLFTMIIVMLLISGCGSSLTEGALGSGNEKEATNILNSKREVVIKKEKILKEENPLAKVKSNSEVKVAKINNEKEKVTSKKEETVEKSKKSTSKEKVPAYTTEKMSGDFMGTDSLNMRKGPSTDFQSVGSLTPYAKAIASEKATLNGDTWYKITTNGVTGWSSANYLVAYKKAETPTKKPTETAAKQPVEKPAEKPKPVQKPSTSVSPSAIEKKVIDLTNAERAKAGLAALKVDNNAVASARAKSNDMATQGYFAHTSPTYGSAGSQLSQFGVSWSAWGENIAQGQSSAEQVVTAWMDSEGHKKNILSTSMTHIGVGHAASGNYWTQQFISN